MLHFSHGLIMGLVYPVNFSSSFLLRFEFTFCCLGSRRLQLNILFSPLGLPFKVNAMFSRYTTPKAEQTGNCRDHKARQQLRQQHAHGYSASLTPAAMVAAS